MASGFAHFDGAHRENFIASALLLLLDLDQEAREVVSRLVASARGKGDLGAIVDFGREVWLGKDADGRKWRSDLWLRFDEGTVLVEVKRHSGWPWQQVAVQVQAQANTNTPVGGARVLDAVLLAPPSLKRAAPERFLSWPDLQRGLRELPSTLPVREAFLRHLEDKVEPSFGLPEESLNDPNELGRMTRVVSCLRSFLQSCVVGVEGSCDAKDLNLTPGNGEPLRWNEWAWFGLSVYFRINGAKPYRIGIYDYSKGTPDDMVSAKEHAWLEVYEENSQLPIVELAFKPSDLSFESLDAVKSEFISTWDALPTARQGG